VNGDDDLCSPSRYCGFSGYAYALDPVRRGRGAYSVGESQHERGVARLSSLHAAVLMIQFSTLVIVLQFLQIFFWSLFYRWYCLPSWESSLYFSASSYSTVGYGDVVLPRVCHLLGPVESVTGVLMCGISVSCLFAVATRLVERESGAPPMQYVNGLDGR